jgi:phosphoribosylaminoimidazole-succinocarboxamide synthase
METKIEKQSPLREGKAKILYSTNHPGNDHIIQYFKDDATAFNAQKRGTIHDKGIMNNAVSSWVFRYLAKHGIPTHYVDRLSDREMLVKKVEIIPVETVIRNVAAGSICKRLGVAKGTKFDPPLIEYFYKSDELGDPLIGETHIAFFKWATREELARIGELAFQVNKVLRQVFQEVGLQLIDFKLEFGRDSQGNVILADEFTPDGSRLWDLKTGEPMDKDRFRQDLGGVEEAYQEVYRRLENFFQGKL